MTRRGSNEYEDRFGREMIEESGRVFARQFGGRQLGLYTRTERGLESSENYDEGDDMTRSVPNAENQRKE